MNLSRVTFTRIFLSPFAFLTCSSRTKCLYIAKQITILLLAKHKWRIHCRNNFSNFQLDYAKYFLTVWLSHTSYIKCKGRKPLEQTIDVFTFEPAIVWCSIKVTTVCVGHFTTISGHFFANYINIFHKIETQTVILRCLVCIYLN